MWQPFTGWFLLLMVSKKSSYSPHRWRNLIAWFCRFSGCLERMEEKTCFFEINRMFCKLRCKSQSLLLNINSWTSQTLEKSGRANCQHQPPICQHECLLPNYLGIEGLICMNCRPCHTIIQVGALRIPIIHKNNHHSENGFIINSCHPSSHIIRRINARQTLIMFKIKRICVDSRYPNALSRNCWQNTKWVLPKIGVPPNHPF